MKTFFSSISNSTVRMIVNSLQSTVAMVNCVIRIKSVENHHIVEYQASKCVHVNYNCVKRH